MAGTATVVTLLLVAAKGFFGWWRQSPALIADAVHSGADAVAIFACWLGLRLAERPPTKRFPFGLYRAETLASLLVSAIILLAGLEMFVENVEGLVRGEAPRTYGVGVAIVALSSALVSCGIFVWERRVGERLGSQSLLANADESRADILTSLAVFAGTAASNLGLPYVELVVAAGLSLLIMWLGAKHGRLAVYALLDASLDPDLEALAAETARGVPGVLAVGQVRLRRTGPFFFGLAQVNVRQSIDVKRGHEVAHRVEDAVKKQVPQLEALIVHVEPYRPTVQTVMVPTDQDHLDGPVSRHFGRARFFLFAEVSSEGIEQVACRKNPFRTEPARAALGVVRQTLERRRVDAVITRRIGEIAFHTLRDYHVDIYAAPAGTARDVLAGFVDNALPLLDRPTHPSKADGAPNSGTEVDGPEHGSGWRQGRR